LRARVPGDPNLLKEKIASPASTLFTQRFSM
jgi:hypothetical protein